MENNYQKTKKGEDKNSNIRRQQSPQLKKHNEKPVSGKSISTSIEKYPVKHKRNG